MISTHTPHAGRDRVRPDRIRMDENFYSHAPCGARRGTAGDVAVQLQISTHTPHAGRDTRVQNDMDDIANFYSHAPCGARLTALPFPDQE